MHLIYVDDYGNTGRRLDDPKQPLFMLFAVLIREDKWIDIERELTEVIQEIAERCDIQPSKFKLHAWEFFSQYKFKQLTFDERAAYAYRVAEIVDRHDGEYVACYVQKHTLNLVSQYVANLFETDGLEQTLAAQGFPKETLPAFRSLAEQVMGVICDPYAFVFADLVGQLESRIGVLDSRGLIIIDRQSEYSSLNTMRTLIGLRKSGVYQRIIEQPLEGSGVINVTLQITDVLGYITGGFLNLAMNQKRFPERHRPTDDLIRKKLTLIDSIARFGDKSRNSSSVMSMLAEMAMARLGIPFNHDQITAAILEANTGLPPVVDMVMRPNSSQLISKFTEQKTGEERPSGLGPQDG